MSFQMPTNFHNYTTTTTGRESGGSLSNKTANITEQMLGSAVHSGANKSNFSFNF